MKKKLIQSESAKTVLFPCGSNSLFNSFFFLLAAQDGCSCSVGVVLWAGFAWAEFLCWWPTRFVSLLLPITKKKQFIKKSHNTVHSIIIRGCHCYSETVDTALSPKHERIILEPKHPLLMKLTIVAIVAVCIGNTHAAACMYACNSKHACTWLWAIAFLKILGSSSVSLFC